MTSLLACLSGREHLTKTAGKLKNRNNLLMKLAGSTWGASANTLRSSALALSSIRRGRTTTTHYTHHQVSLMVSHNTTLVPSLELRIGPTCEAATHYTHHQVSLMVSHNTTLVPSLELRIGPTCEAGLSVV